jgi:hypothetical protein
MKARPRWFAAYCLTSVFGCHFGPLWDFRTSTDHARDESAHCTGYTMQRNPNLFSPALVDRVEPAITHVPSGPVQDEARLRGALIHMAPAPGLTREVLQRALECHEVHVLLGTEPELPFDPYALPGTWLDIAVDSEGDGFAVNVRNDDFPTAQNVLARARRFVAKNP